MRMLLFMIGLVCSLAGKAQMQYRGCVATETEGAVPFAHVLLNKKLVAVADANGCFSFLGPQPPTAADTVYVSAVGVATVKIALVDWTLAKPLAITTFLDAHTLQGVTISKYKARDYWLAVLQELQKALPDTAFTYQAFYRQVHQENGTFVRLIEAGLTLYDVPLNYDAGLLQERMEIEQVRRSNVTERNGDHHGDHLLDLLMENNLRYRKGTVFDAKLVAQFEIDFDTAACHICGDSLTAVTYRYQYDGDPKIRQGRVWVYIKDMRLFGLEEVSLRNPNYVERGTMLGGGDHHWMFQESEKSMRVRYVDGKAYAQNLHFKYLHHISDRAIGMVRYEITEWFSLFFDLPVPRPHGYLPKHPLSRTGNLYSRRYLYRDDYWADFNLANQNQLPGFVEEMFSVEQPLQEQFKKNGE